MFFDKSIVLKGFGLTRQEAQLLTTEEVAGLLRVSPKTLVDWRHDGKGPTYHKFGRMVRYRLSDVIVWPGQAFVPVEAATV